MADINLTLGDFKQAVGMGTRPSRYAVTMPLYGSGEKLEVEVSALTLPESNVPSIQIPFRGRVLKLPGDRRFGAWTFTVYDTDATQQGVSREVWKDLHEWSSQINALEANETNLKYTDFTRDWTIQHYNLNGKSDIKTVRLKHCWPTIVGPIQLAYGAMDQLVQFTCTVEYEYFTVDGVSK